jgi:hypothetical protein
MATPDFVPQNDGNFTSIRYYTATDPYFYTVDNRPLQDIETNLKANRSGGADAARRASYLGSVNLAAALADLYSVPLDSAAPRALTGLAVSNPSTNVIRVGPGAVYESRQTSTSIADVIMKLAQITKTSDFTLTAPVTGGTSIVYTIEGTFVELTTVTLATSQLPNMDSTNAYLPSNLTHGELQLSLNTGTAATTGTEVAPGTTAGKFAIYNITLTQGSSVPYIWAHANAPYIKGLHSRVTPVALTSGGATAGMTNEMPSFAFPDASTTGVALPLVGSTIALNPYKPIKVKVTFVSTVSAGNIVLRLRYSAFGNGDIIANAATTTNNEVIAVTGAGNATQTVTFTTALMPNSAFAGLVSNAWTVTKDKLSIVLERVGAHASDTNTGSLVVLQVALIQ